MDRAEDAQYVGELVKRLARKFPGVSEDAIAETVASVHGELGEARIRDFIPVIVEREVADTLRARARGDDGPV